ncbi:MAG TPA: HDOD domain-containing protein [Spirochaetota bacterium]|nr:HDOD domain-containing protein [Spirochaetota bacterium]HPJ37640.1 HDOD domain-containing protein [Spirochaetota bacterium]HPQ53982.1 HDOD domain-containing protein [Spirochaetota bacterium]
MHIKIKERLESIINDLEQLPSLPDTVSKIINMVNDPNVDFKLIAGEISKDQAITTNLLKLCNSAYFSKGKEISSLDRAIVTLGLKEVKDAVMVITTKPVLNKVVIGYDLTKGMLWEHDLAVAILSKKISMMKKDRMNADVVFTGGIIHDVGKTVLALFVQNAFKEIISVVETKGIPFQEAEKEVMGFDHQEVGAKILSKWNFPEVLKDIVRYHHQPDLAPESSRKLVSTVHVANTICLMAGIGIGSDGLYHELNGHAIEVLKLTDAELEQLYSEMPEVMTQVKEIQ